jgi:hypothetical protein
MTFCCDGFQDLLESAGRRGLSVIVTDSRIPSKRYTFLLQARATDVDQPFAPMTSFPVSTVMEGNINYCPNCGKDLHRYYSHVSLPLRPELEIGWD